MKHLLPVLPYSASALEPHIDARAMSVHHDMHHAAYVKALNEALASAPESLHDKSPEWLLLNLAKVPENIRTTVRNNAGGHLNHSLFWRSMSPDGGGAPSGALADAIDQAFGSFEALKTRFDKAGAEHFRSGWIWLVKAQHGHATLQVLTTPGHDTPLTQGYVPLLLNDVWDHAYYLKQENRRPDYLSGGGRSSIGTKLPVAWSAPGTPRKCQWSSPDEKHVPIPPPITARSKLRFP